MTYKSVSGQDYLPPEGGKDKAAPAHAGGFGTPFVGPISTGLGEIYQYSLEVDEAFAHKYSSADLRAIQDWIIRRQMAMVPGVVEVNAFGGDIKQYEVAVDPSKLKAHNITMSDVFVALESNNHCPCMPFFIS